MRIVIKKTTRQDKQENQITITSIYIQNSIFFEKKKQNNKSKKAKVSNKTYIKQTTLVLLGKTWDQSLITLGIKQTKKKKDEVTKKVCLLQNK